MANFEEHLTELEKVVERLERGDLSLDESVRLFEDGMKLSVHARRNWSRRRAEFRCWLKAKVAA